MHLDLLDQLPNAGIPARIGNRGMEDLVREMERIAVAGALGFALTFQERRDRDNLTAARPLAACWTDVLRAPFE